jgi:hypothetical protein
VHGNVVVPAKLWEEMVDFIHDMAFVRPRDTRSQYLSKWLQLLDTPLGTGVKTLDE